MRDFELIWFCVVFLLTYTRGYLLNQQIAYHIQSGVPFRIYLPANSTPVAVRSIPCLHVDGTNRTIGKHVALVIKGLCINGYNTEHSADYHLSYLSHCSGSDTSRNVTVSFKVLPAYRIMDSRELPQVPVIQGCFTRPPTIALLYVYATKINITGLQKIWELIQRFVLPEEDTNLVDEREISYPKLFQHHRFLISSLEDSRSFFKNMQILAIKEASNCSSPNGSIGDSLVFVWKIGCGAIPLKKLEPLAQLEERFTNGFVPMTWITHAGSPLEINWQIYKWVVGDLKVPSSGQAEAGNPDIFKTRRPREIITDELSGLEGSGFLPTYLSPIVHNQQILLPIKPVNVTVHQITNVQIPTSSFIKPTGIRDLELNLHLPPVNNLTTEQLRSLPVERLGPPITRDPKDWVSFDPKSRIMRLRPTPRQVGEHWAVLCAETKSGVKECEPFLVTVQRPAPFRKNFILRVPPGIYWCYTIPLYWFEELNVDSFGDLELAVHGEWPFSWDPMSKEICIVTSLKSETVITLYILATNNAIAQSVQVEFRLSTKVPGVDSLITFSTLRLKLQWTDTGKPYEMHELTRVNASLAQVLRIRVNPAVSPASLFIYDIINFSSPTEQTYPAIIEMDWLFLPNGIQAEIKKEWSHTVNHFGKPLDAIRNRVPELLGQCKQTKLDGAELAIKATEESFRPFIVLVAALFDLEGSLCQRVVQMSLKDDRNGDRFSGHQWIDGMMASVNMQTVPEVINNFTVIGGVSFQKSIYPEKVTPAQRIQHIDLTTFDGDKLDDSAWLGLTSDNRHIFGLPLMKHFRKQPYNFCLSIYSVDQKTPIRIAFTVEVQNWSQSIEHRRSNAVINPNHRVRLRLLPSTGMNRKWTVSQIHSLDYRWQLSKSIDQFLHPNCPPPCSPDVGLWDLSNLDEHAILVVWAQLSILSEVSTPNGPECPWDQINRLQHLLTFAPSAISTTKNRGLVTGYVRNSDNSMYLAPWAAPSTAFRDYMEKSGLGTVEAAVVDRMGVCARGSDRENSTRVESVPRISSGGIDREPNELRFTIYTGEGFRQRVKDAAGHKEGSHEQMYLFDTAGQKIGSSNWIGLEADQSTVYGILMGSAVQPTTYRFRIASSATDHNAVQFSVFVAGMNPDLPPIHNHRVIIRFGSTDNAAKNGVGGHSLIERWRLVIALDTYIRPHCQDNALCQNDMDVLLLTFNYQAHGFTVIWAQKSLLKQSFQTEPSSTRYDLSEQRRHWDQWIGKQDSGRLRRRNLKLESPDSAGICPEQQVASLERRLLGDSGLGYLPHPELAHHFKYAGVGVITEVHVERIGPCKHAIGSFPLILPEVPIPPSQELTRLEPDNQGRKQDLITSSDFQPTNKRILLLSLLIPGCLLVVVGLVAILVFVLYKKRSSFTSGNAKPKVYRFNREKLCNKLTICKNPVKMLRRKDKNKTDNDVNLDIQPNVNMKANTRDSTRAKSGTHHNFNGVEDSATAPTRPLILPNERPPLKPQEYNMGYSGSPTITGYNQPPTQIHGSFSPKVFYGARPNPYRNLPPPIDLHPSTMTTHNQTTFTTYRKAPVP